MTPESVVETMRQMLMAAFWLAAPLLAIGFVAGILISLLAAMVLPAKAK